MSQDRFKSLNYRKMPFQNMHFSSYDLKTKSNLRNILYAIYYILIQLPENPVRQHRWLMAIVVPIYLYANKKQTIIQCVMKNTVCENNSLIHYRTIVRNNKTLIIWKITGLSWGGWALGKMVDCSFLHAGIPLRIMPIYIRGWRY